LPLPVVSRAAISSINGNYTEYLGNYTHHDNEWRLPAIYQNTGFAEMGGLLTYSANFPEMFRRAAINVDKILRGANPADLPVEQPTKFELVVNLQTARRSGSKFLRHCSPAPTE
jgi:ABC-type uncharacterized transport system substrate-binding protein